MTDDAANKRWTDTMGRVIDDPMPMNWDSFQQTQVVEDKVAHFPSKDGGTFDVTLSWRYLKDPNGGESGLEDPSQTLNNLSNVGCQGNANRPIPAPYLFINPEPTLVRVCNPIGWSGMNWWVGPPFNPIVMTKITLPNGQKYEFKYNVYGEISKIIYPTGAYERFLYGAAPLVQPQGVSYDQANRGVVERWVSPKGDGTDELHWTYQNGTVIAPDGTKTQQFIYTESQDAPQPYGFGNAKTGSPYEERVLSPTNQILRRKLTGYEVTGPQTGGYSAATRDLRPNKEVSIIIEPGASYALAQMTETVYDTNSDPQYFAQLNPKQVKTYNYIVLDLTTAQTANIDQISALFTGANLAKTDETDYLYDANYKARNITGLATETRVKDASGNVRAKSQISYDEGGYSLASTGTMPSAAANSWVDPITELGSTLGSKRGLPTTVRPFWDVSANQYIETHSFYDQYGNVRKVRDGRNNDTETEYDDDYAFSYPTRVTTPIPDITGINGSNTAFTTVTVYDYNTGLPTSVTDANGQTRQMQFNDSLLRPTKVISPNGQETITEYGAGTSEATRFVKIKTQIDAEKRKENYTWFDGLNRTAKTQMVDSNGDVFVETEYDNMGRVKKVTNPYRSGETKLWTENFYDDLGRMTKVKSPDNAETETFYSLAISGSQIGTVTTAEDQTDKQKRSITNALGWLTRVDEPDGSNQLGAIDNPNQATVYSYDILNNLLQVQQNGTNTQQCGGTTSTCSQTRTFVYDSLSRLKQATNPESGTVQYTYDANGNLKTKTDARGIKTIHDYDNLNRVIKRCYTVPNPQGSPTNCGELTGQDTNQNTLAVTYVYDNLPNAKEKLMKVITGDTQSPFSKTEYTEFDILGRVTKSRQTTDGTAYNEMLYTYNLLGTVIEQTYPSGRVVKNVLDNDGELSIVQSKKNQNYGFWNYAQHFTYTASGDISSMQLGNGRWESTQFNSRLQPTQIALGTIQNGIDKLKLNYSYGTWEGGTINAQKNNGNVAQQIITVPTIGQTQGFTATQNYYYDSLNRVQQATETIPNQTGWQQTFLYDRYGNRRFDTANTTTLAPGCAEAVCNPQINPANNRLSGYQFDNAGNTTRDAENRTFIYDAENKQIEVRNSQNQPIGQYFYDGYGKRVKKYVPSTGEVSIFLYDASGKLVAEYSTIVAASSEAKVGYLTNDNIASPRINTDANGNITSRHDYQPFGEEIARTGYGADSVRKKFTGYERDNEIGLDFAQARYYNSMHGRFNSVDPNYDGEKTISRPASHKSLRLYQKQSFEVC